MRYTTSHVLALTGTLSLVHAYVPPSSFHGYPGVAFPAPFMPNPAALHGAHAPPVDTTLKTDPIILKTEDPKLKTVADKNSENIVLGEGTIIPTEEGSHHLAHAAPEGQVTTNATRVHYDGPNRLAHLPPDVVDPTKIKSIVLPPPVLPPLVFPPFASDDLMGWIYARTIYNMASVKDKTKEECDKLGKADNIRYLKDWPTRVENNIQGPAPTPDLIPLCTIKKDVALGCHHLTIANFHDKAEKMGIDGISRTTKANEWEKDRVMELENDCPRTEDELVKKLIKATETLKWDPKLDEVEAKKGLALLGWGSAGSITLPVKPEMSVLPVKDEKEVVKPISPPTMSVLPVMPDIQVDEAGKKIKPKIGTTVTLPDSESATIPKKELLEYKGKQHQ